MPLETAEFNPQQTPTRFYQQARQTLQNVAWLIKRPMCKKVLSSGTISLAWQTVKAITNDLDKHQFGGKTSGTD